MAKGWIHNHYIEPQFHFKYFGFEWVEVLPGNGMYFIHILMVAAALGILFGAFFRFSAVLFFLLFTYTELIDLTYYLNHYYFVSLVALAMCFLPANGQASVDQKMGRVPTLNQVPRGNLFVIKFLIGLVYVYAGVAKMQTDWLLDAMPLKIWLPAHTDMPLIGSLMDLTATAYVFSWVGMLYDTFIIFFLIWPKTRLYAWIMVVVFHSLTGYFFQIGVFPLVMTLVTLIFFSNRLHQPIVDFFSRYMLPFKLTKSKKKITFFYSKYSSASIVFLVIFQLVFPWRFILYPGDLFWTEQGYRFSWRVMLMEKAGTAHFYVKDSQTGREGVAVNSEFLNPHQEKQMAFQPDMILQFAHFLGAYYETQGVVDPKVRCETYVTLNGKPSQLLINPEIDLLKIDDSFAHKEWILPYKQ